MHQRIIFLNAFFWGFWAMAWGQTTSVRQYDLAVKETAVSQLPDSIQTYKLQFQSEVSERFSSVNAAAARKIFQVGRLLHVETNAAAVLDVRVLVPGRQSKRQQRKARDTGNPLYRYEENITMPVVVQLSTASGVVLYRDTARVEQNFRTAEYPADAPAQRAFDQRVDLPAYGALLREGYQKAVNKAAKRLKLHYVSEEIPVSLYYTNDMDSVLLERIRAIRAALLQYNVTLTPGEVQQQITPHLAVLDSAWVRQMSTGGNPDQVRAYALTLTNVYRCLGDETRANAYLRPVKDTPRSVATAPVRSAVSPPPPDKNGLFQPVKDYVQLYREEPVRSKWAAQQRQMLVTRLDSLKNIREARGFAVMTNGDTIRGVFLDLVENFIATQVVFKYEKKLNAPILDAAYPLVQVREMHIPDWHLAVVQTDVRFELAEILYQSPGITYCRLIPTLTKELSVDSDDMDYFYLKKPGETTYTMRNYENLSELAKYFDDCPGFAQRFYYRHYKPSQLVTAMMDYDSICGATTTKKGKNKNNTLDRGRSPGFMLGFNFGFNGYTGLGGVSAMTRFAPHVYGRFGLGLGAWGVKYSAGIKYDFRRDLRFRPGMSLAAGFTHSRGQSGVVNVATESALIVDDKTISSNKVDVDILQKPANTVYLAMVFNYFFTKHSSINLELGYAQSISKSPWVLLPGGTGRDNAEDAIKLYQPGGILFGFGVHAGF
jgi:hypothetical protein